MFYSRLERANIGVKKIVFLQKQKYDRLLFTGDPCFYTPVTKVNNIIIPKLPNYHNSYRIIFHLVLGFMFSGHNFKHVTINPGALCSRP